MEDLPSNLSGRLRQIKFIRLTNRNGTGLLSTTVPDFTKALNPFYLTAAFEFLRHLPLLAPADLPGDKQACDICYEPYGSILGTHAEMPTKLPCQHVIGRSCIGEWILPRDARPNTSCPMCRSKLFSDQDFVGSLTSQPSDAADWVQETWLLYQGDPDAGERMELLVDEMERVSNVDGHRTSTEEPMELPADHLERMSRVDGRDMADFFRWYASELVDAVADLD